MTNATPRPGEAASLSELGIVRANSDGEVELGYDYRYKVFTVETLDNGNIVLRPIYSQAKLNRLPTSEAVTYREAGKFYTAP